jgi:HTH-type transcriptional regulator/antitoxin MqsA
MLHRDVRPLTLTYKGESITFDMPGWYGDEPDQGVFDPEDMKVSDRALNRLKARTEGFLEPEEIRRVRKKLGLSQEAAGELIGGGPRAFQKYETGDSLRAVPSAVRLPCSTMIRRPSTCSKPDRRKSLPVTMRL